MYRIRCYIEVEAEECTLYADREEAEDELNHLECLQPQNIYVVEEVLEGN